MKQLIAGIGFTTRELHIMELNLTGALFADVAVLLNTTETAIRRAHYQLYQKTGMGSRLELALWYLEKTGRLAQLKKQAVEQEAAFEALRAQVAAGELSICFG